MLIRIAPARRRSNASDEVSLDNDYLSAQFFVAYLHALGCPVRFLERGIRNHASTNLQTTA